MKQDDHTALEKYKGWFLAAAIYNALWGAVNGLFPTLFFDLINAPHPRYLPLWQVTAMFVMVYAPAYWWASRRLFQHRHIIFIGLLGKVLGPLGFVWAASQGQLPWAFGWTNLTNDLIWWPSFTLFIIEAVRLSGGWKAFLRGE